MRAEVLNSPSSYTLDAWANLTPLAAFADSPVADTAETVTPQAGVVGAEPDRDDGHTMSHARDVTPS